MTSSAAVQNDLANLSRLWDVMRTRTDLPEEWNVYLRAHNLHDNRAQKKKTVKTSMSDIMTGPTFGTVQSQRYHNGLQNVDIDFAYGMVRFVSSQRATMMLHNPLEALNRLDKRLPKLIACLIHELTAIHHIP